jgi:Retrotransposon gag protein
MPKFDRGSDPESYLTRELKINKIFCNHNYSEEKKLAMASLEFDDYALICWEQDICDREDVGQPAIVSWTEMKREMRGRFVPRHYRRDLFDKLHNLKHGNLSVEEYYKEMEKAIIRTNINEREEQSMARFMLGLHRNIQRIVEFQPYQNLDELVHQLQQDVKSRKVSPYSTRVSEKEKKRII